ncbi:CBO0543 family protein [Rossellomorea vietnamensis]|uniref:CBO0543 family protein n=1 Tax=Rossellomorea vietnamensis TaxID=218284 RepID=UPI003CF474FF
MHTVLTITLLSFAYFKGNWREWEKYHLTIFYVIICNLLYNMIAQDKLLWEYYPDILPKSHTLVDILYSFINLPVITLLYLTHFPFNASHLMKVRYIALWSGVSFVIEYPFYKFGRLLLQNGYEYWMDIFFYIVMYSMIRLHFSRPFLTYILSAIIAAGMIWLFEIPLP